MPGSCARRKRDNLNELSGSNFLPTGRVGGISMSTFEWNKIIASVLTAMIVAMVSGILAGKLVAPRELAKPAYLPVAAEAPAPSGGAQQGAAAGPEPIEPLLAKADPKKGEQVAKVCAQCHTFNKGGANKIGPNLWGITEENMAAVPGYQFSAAMEAHKNEKWDPDKLNQWLWKPQSLIKGTKMTFAGIPKADDRADVIAYLETLK
jgi:cytochrome c